MLSLGMLSAVEFDHELMRWTGEIDDERTDRMLSSEPLIGKAFAQRPL